MDDALNAGSDVKRGRMPRVLKRVGRPLIVLSVVGLLLTLGLWLAQLRGPIYACEGPEFRDVRWFVAADSHFGSGWFMADPSGAKDVYSTTVGGRIPFRAVEVPQKDAPPMDGEAAGNSLLIGAGFGYFHLGQAYFESVPAPKTAPAPGMIYVSPSHQAVSIPIWLIALLFALYPTATFVRGPLRRWHRAKQGLCPQCGYDLRGNVSGRCPECGKPVGGE